MGSFLYFALRLGFFVRTVWCGRLFCLLVQSGKIVQAGFFIFLMGPLSGLRLVLLLVRLFGWLKFCLTFVFFKSPKDCGVLVH